MTEIKGETSIIIQSPTGAIYDYLLDFTKHSEWTYNLSRVQQVSPGPIGVGATFHAQEGPPPVELLTKLRMMVFFVAGLTTGAKSYSEAKITALEPGRRIAWRAGIPKGQSYFNQAEWEIILEPRQGATRLIQRFCYQPQTALAERMVGTAGKEGIEQSCAVNLARLKRLLEQQPALAA
jgi:uncharacterized membrane protein